jgi:hypothetical protein
VLERLGLAYPSPRVSVAGLATSRDKISSARGTCFLSFCGFTVAARAIASVPGGRCSQPTDHSLVRRRKPVGVSSVCWAKKAAKLDGSSNPSSRAMVVTGRSV